MSPVSRRFRRVVLALLLIAPGLAGLGRGQDAAPVVYVVPVQGTIDLGLAPLLARGISEAEAAGASAVVLDINTFGGRVDAAVAMRDSLLNASIPTIAFVNQRAISAGALITLACETIVMTEGGTVGAAAPVVSGVGASQPADEKSVSYVRTEFRATAERRGRPADVAEAMVDADVAIDGLIEADKLLTLTAADAIRLGVADHLAEDLDAVLAAVELADATIEPVTGTWAETVVRGLTNPIVSSVLMSLGLLGLLMEIRTPGFGVPGMIGVAALGSLFWGHWIVQLAGWEEVLLLIAGVVLLVVEAFVIPGFGIAGGLGIAAIVAALGLTVVGEGATASAVVRGLGRAAFSILVALMGAIVLLRYLPKTPFGRRLILETSETAAEGYRSPPADDREWLGRSGSAASPLRPSGVADIDGRRVDVVSDGNFIEAGAPVVVTRVDGNRVVVRRAEARRKESS